MKKTPLEKRLFPMKPITNGMGKYIPYCNYEKVKRLFIGVWNCKKCGAKFSGKAYTIGKNK